MGATKKNLSVDLLEINEGQMYGLPRNPRWIRDARFEALKKSIEDAPEMLDLREILVYPLADLEGHEDHYIVIGGNMRLRACIELGYKELPCKVLDLETPVKKLREYVIKDNQAFGQDDYDLLSSEWSDEELQDWGFELPYGAGEFTDEDYENEEGGDDEKKPELTEEELRDLIDKASAGSIVDYNDDTNYDLTQLYRPQGDHLKEALEDAVAKKQIRPEIAELCRMRLAQCTIINFDQVIKYYRSDDSTAAERELLKKLYLVFITPREAVEAQMLKFIATTGKIFEQEISGGGDEIEEEEIEDVYVD